MHLSRKASLLSDLLHLSVVPKLLDCSYDFNIREKYMLYSKQNDILDLLYFSERYAGDSDYCCGVFVSSPRLSAWPSAFPWLYPQGIPGIVIVFNHGLLSHTYHVFCIIRWICKCSQHLGPLIMHNYIGLFNKNVNYWILENKLILAMLSFTLRLWWAGTLRYPSQVYKWPTNLHIARSVFQPTLSYRV